MCDWPFCFVRELQEINEEFDPTSTQEQKTDEADKDDQACIHNCLHHHNIHHLWPPSQLFLIVILTKKAQDPVADEEPANESLQKKVDFS